MKKKVTIAIFIDAFGWELLQKHPFLEDMMTIKSPLETVFGYNSSCIPTILTGLSPRDHGHFSFFRYDPSCSPFYLCKPLAFFPDLITSLNRVRRMTSHFIQRWYGYTGCFQIYQMPFSHLPLFDYCEKQDLYQPGGINGGKPTIFDFMRLKGVPFFLSDWRESEEKALAGIGRILEEGRVEFAYLYLAEMEDLLHVHGKSSDEAARKVRWYDREIRKIVEKARKNYREVEILLFSDHGMADIHSLCDLMAQIKRTGLSFGKDYAAVYDSTMARFWFLKERAEATIRQVLKEEKAGRILSPEELRTFRCDFPGERYGQLFFLMNPGVLLCPNFMGDRPLAGMHGYDPRDKDSVAIFASNHKRERHPGRLEDLFGVMAGGPMKKDTGVFEI